MVQRLCSTMVLLLLLVLVLVLALAPIPLTVAYSLDQDHSLGFRGPPSSMFGYSVLLHRHKTQTWLVVGAPVANSSSNPFTLSPGAIYRCGVDEHGACQLMHADVSRCGKTCEAESDHQWLGVSLSRQPGDNGHILVKKQNHKNHHILKFGEDYGSCQAGISNVLTEDLIVMGAPGTSYWTGSVLVYNTTSRAMAVYLDDNSETISFGSYLGYSVAAGHFLSPSSLEVVGGAPQYNQRGKVYIFSIESSMLRHLTMSSCSQLGSYFGSSVCAVDLNADGLSDLLVGAPMATGAAREEGRVHVYMNQGEAELLEAEFQLKGSDAYAARFGEAIADLGDLDDDGYPDVAVGAPQEDELRGAVYIYNGREDGISPTPSQRITGSMLGRDLRMFGQSLSSGVDIDGNGYQDVAIGAFLSDSAVVLRTRPVVRVEASLVLPEQVDQQVALCRDHKTPSVCFNVTVCFTVSSRQYRGAIDLQYNLTSDLLHKPSFPHRFYFHGNGSSNSTKGRVRARLGQLTCTSHLALQRKDVRDIFTPIRFEVSYGLRETHAHRSPSRSLPPLKPILQQKLIINETIETRFARSCFLLNCSTDMQLSAQLVLRRPYFALGSTRTVMLNATVTNAGDDAFLPRLTLRFPDHIHYVRVLQTVSFPSPDWLAQGSQLADVNRCVCVQDDALVSCDLIQEVNSTVGVDCGVSGLLLPAHTQVRSHDHTLANHMVCQQNHIKTTEDKQFDQTADHLMQTFTQTDPELLWFQFPN
uniref:Uncharacterized protein n=1 Tax=Sphaeramia orbicularis TaxID=375764 RepID=A0A672Z4Z3_9TELE